MNPDSDEAESLNLRAYIAMSRLNPDVVDRLVELLRSDAPIDPLVRHAMADAFEGKSADDRVTFEITNKTRGHMGDYGERLKKFQRDMAIARFIEEQRQPPNNLTLDAAAEEAERVFGIGVKTCKAAVGKHRDMEKWMRRNYPQRPHRLATISHEQYRHIMEIEYQFLMEARRLSEAPRLS